MGSYSADAIETVENRAAVQTESAFNDVLKDTWGRSSVAVEKGPSSAEGSMSLPGLDLVDNKQEQKPVYIEDNQAHLAENAKEAADFFNGNSKDELAGWTEMMRDVAGLTSSEVRQFVDKVNAAAPNAGLEADCSSRSGASIHNGSWRIHFDLGNGELYNGRQLVATMPRAKHK